MNSGKVDWQSLSEAGPTLTSILHRAEDYYLHPFPAQSLNDWAARLNEVLDEARQSYVPRSPYEPAIHDSFDLLEQLFDADFGPLMCLLRDILVEVERRKIFTPVTPPGIKSNSRSEVTVVNTLLALFVVDRANHGDGVLATKAYYELKYLPERRFAKKLKRQYAGNRRGARKGGAKRKSDADERNSRILKAARKMESDGIEKKRIAGKLAERFDEPGVHQIRKILKTRT